MSIPAFQYIHYFRGYTSELERLKMLVYLRLTLLLGLNLSLVYLHYFLIFKIGAYHEFPNLDDFMHIAGGVSSFTFSLFFISLLKGKGYFKNTTLTKLVVTFFILFLPSWEAFESLMSYIFWGNGAIKPLEILRDSSFAMTGGLASFIMFHEHFSLKFHK